MQLLGTQAFSYLGSNVLNPSLLNSRTALNSRACQSRPPLSLSPAQHRLHHALPTPLSARRFRQPSALPPPLFHRPSTLLAADQSNSGETEQTGASSEELAASEQEEEPEPSFRAQIIAAFTDTHFDAAILALAIPALGSLIIDPVVRTAEAVMVGRLGAAPLGALSIGGSVVSVCFPLFNFFSYATTPMVARALARDDPEEASALVAQGIWLSTFVGCSLGLIIFFGADKILGVLGANAEIFPYAKAFLLVRAFAAPADLWLLVAKGASYGHQNTKAPLFAIGMGSAVHLALDALFIVGCKLSLAGAALAVVISQYVAAILLLRSLLVARILRLESLRQLPSITKIRNYLSAGSALLIRTMSMQTFYTIMTSTGARMGTAVIAAHAIARQCTSLEALVVDGLAVAAQALVAMYIGKGDLVSARRISMRLLVVGAVTGCFLGLLLFALSGPITAAFTTDASVIAEARRAMPLVAALQVPAALAYIFDGIFLGARDFKFLGLAMAVSVVPAAAVLWAAATFLDVGLLTLWMASGSLLIFRVCSLSYRFASSRGPLKKLPAPDPRGPPNNLKPA